MPSRCFWNYLWSSRMVLSTRFRCALYFHNFWSFRWPAWNWRYHSYRMSWVSWITSRHFFALASKEACSKSYLIANANWSYSHWTCWWNSRSRSTSSILLSIPAYSWPCLSNWLSFASESLRLYRLSSELDYFGLTTRLFHDLGWVVRRISFSGSKLMVSFGLCLNLVVSLNAGRAVLFTQFHSI